MTLPAVIARSPKGDAAIQGPPALALKRGDARHTADLGSAPLDRRVPPDPSLDPSPGVAPRDDGGLGV